MLIAKNITKKIDKQEILKGMSISLKSGEVVSIIGPSGAGKSTFLRSLSLIDLPDSGSLKIENSEYFFPISNPKQIAYPYPNLTVVFQQSFMWPHMTIRQNLTLPIGKKIDCEYFDEVVNLFKLENFLDRHPNEISVGQNQRAAIARALLLKPKYLLLDEITSASDIEQSYLILNHIKKIAEKGIGVIFVSHALHFVKKISKKIIFIDHGMVIEEGTGLILSNPKTKRLQKFISMAQQTI